MSRHKRKGSTTDISSKMSQIEDRLETGLGEIRHQLGTAIATGTAQKNPDLPKYLTDKLNELEKYIKSSLKEVLMRIYNKESLKCAQLNVRSLLAHFDSVKTVLLQNNFHILGITESWFDKNIPDDAVHIDHHNFVRLDRGSRGGSVGFYIRNNLKCTYCIAKE
nr:unnamed protein product [Callosobruchus analis]